MRVAENLLGRHCAWVRRHDGTTTTYTGEIVLVWRTQGAGWLLALRTATGKIIGAAGAGSSFQIRLADVKVSGAMEPTPEPYERASDAAADAAERLADESGT